MSNRVKKLEMCASSGIRVGFQLGCHPRRRPRWATGGPKVAGGADSEGVRVGGRAQVAPASGLMAATARGAHRCGLGDRGDARRAPSQPAPGAPRGCRAASRRRDEAARGGSLGATVRRKRRVRTHPRAAVVALTLRTRSRGRGARGKAAAGAAALSSTVHQSERPEKRPSTFGSLFPLARYPTPRVGIE